MYLTSITHIEAAAAAYCDCRSSGLDDVEVTLIIAGIVTLVAIAVLPVVMCGIWSAFVTSAPMTEPMERARPQG